MPMEKPMNNYNFERMFDKIDSIIDYELQEQVEYMIQDAFGVASFDELDSDQIAVLKSNLPDPDQEVFSSLTVNCIRYNIDRWEEENV
jgi:hypothetical protein